MKKYLTKNDVKTNKGKKSLIMEGSFFQTPKALLKNKKYHKLTPAAVLVYIELWDRIGLSIVNNMQDDKDRYYVKMSRENSDNELGVSSKTFERAKEQLVNLGLLEIKEINSRVHHLYIFRPEETEETIIKEDEVDYEDKFKGMPIF